MEDNKNVRWYVLATVTGHEAIAKQNLETVIRKNAYLQNRIFDIVIPMMEEIVEDKDGKKVPKQVKRMPGYILVKMIYGDDLWHDVTRTPSITSFVGPNARAIPLTDEEVARLNIEETKFSEQVICVGDSIEVLSGTFAGKVAKVERVDEAKKTCVVNIEMFNRYNEVELEFGQVKKL